MKSKLFYAILVVVMAFCAGCGNEGNREDVDASKEENTSEEKEQKGLSVDKGLLTNEVTFPAILFEGQDVEKVIAGAKAKGVQDVKKNEDGSFTYKMSKSTYSDLLKEMEKDVKETLEELKTSGDFRSIKDVTYNKTFSEVTLVVDKESFENSFDGLATFGVGISSMFYQVFSGKSKDDVKVVIHLKDGESGQVFDTVTYPQDLDKNSN